MSTMVFLAEDRITDIPDQNNAPDMIQVTGSCQDTKLVLLTVRLGTGAVSGNINPKKSAGVVTVPKAKFEELRDCFDEFIIKIDLSYADNGAHFSVTDICSRPAGASDNLRAKVKAKSDRIERDARDIIQANADVLHLLKSALPGLGK